jgi:hypothetical protein
MGKELRYSGDADFSVHPNPRTKISSIPGTVFFMIKSLVKHLNLKHTGNE